nr:S-adenosylmethionine decarboxylase [Pectinatus sottacetonis]
MYNCKPEKIVNIDLLSVALKNTLHKVGLTVLEMNIKRVEQDHFIVFIPLMEGHFTTHIYSTLRYVAIDLFICNQDSSSEKAVRALRKVIKPEKIKITYLCRGDFGTISDMKPHIKVRTAPLRRIQNTGVKVIHLLPGRKFVKKLRRKNKQNIEN